MVLTANEITSKGIVFGAMQIGQRSTTYDATVGAIIHCGVEIDENSFALPPRGIVWVVSAEDFALPQDVTGLATLKTQWTHQGVLALNVGVVDPGWHGPLAAAVVNFSNSVFVIKKGDPFFRILFHEHRAVGQKVDVPRSQYLAQVKNQSRAFSSTFLNMSSLVKEVSDEVLGLPRIAQNIAKVGIVIALVAIFVPISLAMWIDFRKDPVRLAVVERKLADMEESAKTITVETPARLDFKKCKIARTESKWQATCDVVASAP